jgi:regulator of sigma E protease
MSILITLLLVIVVLGLLIFVHELGHFLAARSVGAQVFEFALGFGPRLISKEYKGTRYSIRAIPLGGFVNILGDGDPSKLDEESLKKSNPDGNLKNKSKWAQAFVMLAGIFMNLLLAIVCYYIVIGFSGWKISLSYDFEDFHPVGADIVKERVSDVPYEVLEDTFAEMSDMPESGYIKEINGQGVEYVEDISQHIEGNDVVDITACVEENTCDVYEVKVGEDGKVGVAIGVNYLVYIDYSQKKIFAGASHLINDVRLIGRIFGTLFKEAKQTGDYSTLSRSVSGPVGIYFLVDYFKDLGWIPFISLIADLSLSLAIMNILPIPALDGGRVLIVAIEGILKKDIDPKVEAIIINVSFIILMVFVVFVMIKDIVNIDQLKSLFE